MYFVNVEASTASYNYMFVIKVINVISLHNGL